MSWKQRWIASDTRSPVHASKAKNVWWSVAAKGVQFSGREAASGAVTVSGGKFVGFRRAGLEELPVGHFCPSWGSFLLALRQLLATLRQLGESLGAQKSVYDPGSVLGSQGKLLSCTTAWERRPPGKWPAQRSPRLQRGSRKHERVHGIDKQGIHAGLRTTVLNIAGDCIANLLRQRHHCLTSSLP